MEPPLASNPSTSVESEATMDCQLRLTTMAGNEITVSTNIAQFDIFEDFEEHIVDYYLAAVSDLDVFGSELDIVHPITQECLQDRGLGRLARE